MKNYRFLNVCRLIMALFVILNHLHPFDKLVIKNNVLYNLYWFIIQLAVPFFFLSTGFFLGKKIENIEEMKKNDYIKIKQMLFKLTKIYIIFTLIYMPLTIYGFKHIYIGIPFLKTFIKKFLFIGENYNSWILWYILSEIYGLLVIYMLKNKVKNNNILIIIGFILFLIGLCIELFNGLSFEQKILTIIQNRTKTYIPKGRILSSLLFISLGMFISKNESIKNKELFIIVMMIMLVINAFINNLFISNICRVICSYIIFKTIININFKNQKISDYCKIASKDFYFWHLYIYSIFQLIIEGNISNKHELSYFYLTIVSLFLIASIHFIYKNLTQQNHKRDVHEL